MSEIQEREPIYRFEDNELWHLPREQGRELETRTRLSLGLSLCAGAGAVILLL